MIQSSAPRRRDGEQTYGQAPRSIRVADCSFALRHPVTTPALDVF
jgi:hypothetical protein